MTDTAAPLATPLPLEVEQIPVAGHPLPPAPLKSEQIPPIPPDKLPDIPIEKIPAEARPQQPVAPKTTLQEDLTTLGHRNINVMWERTQQVISLMIVAAALAVIGYLVVYGDAPLRLLALSMLSNILFLVVGTYFQRTNHTKVGGVGVTAAEQERGR